MFLHLGEDVIVPKNSIIGIFDLKICFKALPSREFIEIAKSENKINTIGNKEKIKTFIITKEGIYLSPISSITLSKRFEQIFKFNNEEE